MTGVTSGDYSVGHVQLPREILNFTDDYNVRSCLYASCQFNPIRGSRAI
jgi:hypothetical protein